MNLLINIPITDILMYVKCGFFLVRSNICTHPVLIIVLIVSDFVISIELRLTLFFKLYKQFLYIILL